MAVSDDKGEQHPPEPPGDGKAAGPRAPFVDKVKILTGPADPGSAVSRYDLSARPRKVRARQKRTLEQLYQEAGGLGIHGRSDMNKQELEREVDRKKRQ
jgi:hypothetical protein